MGKKCSEDECNTYATYGTEKNKPIHCNKHKTNDERDVLNKQCEKCEKKQATYGIEKKKAKWCKTCKPEDAFDVKHKMCENEECNTRPTFGSIKSVRCLLHKLKDDKPFGYKYCEVKNCKLVPSFSDNIDNIALRCSKHKLTNWMDVSHLSTLCKFKDCKLQCTYGLHNEKPEYCSKHKSVKMIDLKHERCLFDNCNIQASFGELNGKRLYCTKHKEDDHISLKNMIHGNLYQSLYNVFCSVKSKDKLKNKTFDLTLDFLFNLYENQNKQCFYCNNILNVKSCNKKQLDQVSIDRKDSSLTHIKQNCVITCLFCNLSKTDSSYDLFKLYLKFIQNPKTKYQFDIEDKNFDWVTPIMYRIKSSNKQTDITKTWLKEQFLEQKGVCKYTKVPMIITEEKRHLFKPSVERINCELEYTTDNCVLVCLATNYGRSDIPLEDYLNYIIRVQKSILN